MKRQIEIIVQRCEIKICRRREKDVQRQIIEREKRQRRKNRVVNREISGQQKGKKTSYDRPSANTPVSAYRERKKERRFLTPEEK